MVNTEGNASIPQIKAKNYAIIGSAKIPFITINGEKKLIQIR
jgi:hypothetical protein